MPHHGQGAGIAAKHGQVGLMRAAAKELASRHIRVNTMHPGIVGAPWRLGGVNTSGRATVSVATAASLVFVTLEARCFEGPHRGEREDGSGRATDPYSRIPVCMQPESSATCVQVAIRTQASQPVRHHRCTTRTSADSLPRERSA
jgi:NAD(P)-dependent dehydrogenase (short-subunit alcohol dehydrogenase family)